MGVARLQRWMEITQLCSLQGDLPYAHAMVPFLQAVVMTVAEEELFKTVLWGYHGNISKGPEEGKGKYLTFFSFNMLSNQSVVIYQQVAENTNGWYIVKPAFLSILPSEWNKEAIIV